MPPDENPPLFDGTEKYYARYRPKYGTDALEYLVERFDLDDSARVLDLGCGAGQIAIPLAAYVRTVVGMDPNTEMIQQARQQAESAGRENIEWIVGSDEDLSDDLGPFRLTTMGRSFHWMEQEATLKQVHRITESGGGVAILDDEEWLTRGTQEWQAVVYETADEYLTDLPPRTGPVEYEDEDPWDELIEECGFTDVELRTLDVTREWNRDSIVGYVFSLSFCSPAVFGEDKEAFEEETRTRLSDLEESTFEQNVTISIISGRK